MTDEVLTADAPPPQAGRQAAFGFIFASAIMNALSFGLMIPVLPALLKSFIGGDPSHATASAALWQMVFALSWGAVQFFSGPVLGLMSDRFGRRPVMLISIFGLSIDFVIMAFAPSLMWLFVGRLLNGLTASSNSTAMAYVADVTPPMDRARRFGMMGSAFSVGFLLGPVVGGYLGEISLRLPFMVAAGMCLVNGIYGLFILPESLPLARRVTRFVWSKANPVASLGFLKAHGELMRLAMMFFLFQLSQTVWPMCFVLYSQYRFHWSTGTIGMVMMISGASGVVTQMWLVGPIVRRLGERRTLLVGAVCGAIGLAIYGWAPTAPLYFIGMPFSAFSGLMMPGIMGLMSRRVSGQEQGQLQGSNQSLQGLSSIVGPLVYGPTLAWAVANDATLHLPGLPIFLSSGFIVLIFLLGLGVRRSEPIPAAAE